MTAIIRILVFLCSFCSGMLLAQDFRATLNGTVTDSSKSSIPNVVVQVTNVATNEVASATTNNQGNYTIPFLKPGTYTVTAQGKGFKQFVRRGVVLDVAQTGTVDIKLELGAVTEEVTVTAEAPLLETSKADRGGIVDTQRVEELPLNARNPFMLSMLTAGVNYNGNAIYQRPFDNGAIAEWSINGGSRGRGGNEFLLDGASNNAQAGGNNIAYVPPVDAVAEFKIQTNSYDAQYGKTSGGIINVSLKSGTNSLHGTAYEFARRNAWDANSFQNNANGAPRSGHFLDQYGSQLSGPVYFPHLYDGRNKTFFMFNYEGYREAQPNPQSLSVPTAEMIDQPDPAKCKGVPHCADFSKLVDKDNQQITIYDPSKGVNSKKERTVFLDNIIPANRINPMAREFLLRYMPKPNIATPNQAYAQRNYFVPGGKNLDIDDFYNLVAKVDKNIGDKQRMFFRYAANSRTEHRGTGLPTNSLSDDRFVLKRINNAAVVDWVATFSQTLLMNIRTSYSRYIEGSRGIGAGGFDLTSLGFPASLVQQLPVKDVFGRYEFEGYMSLGNTTNNYNFTNSFSIHPSVTKIHGSHDFRTGVDMRWIQYAIQNTGNPFRIQNRKDLTQKVYDKGDALNGNSIATFLLGTPSTFTVDDNNRFPMYLYKYFAPYIQDDWKVSHRLTMSLGLRWDFNIPPNERHNWLNRSFDENAVNPVDKLVDHHAFPQLPTLKGGLLFAGVGGVPRIATNIDWHDIQPRVGFAYLLTSRLVLRGGWGRYYVNPNNDYLQTTGFTFTTPYISSLDNNRTFLKDITLSSPFPKGILPTPGNSQGLLTSIGRGPAIVNPRFKIPHVDQFSFGFQYQLPFSSRVEISYVGSRSRNLEDSRSFNEISLETRQSCNLLEGGNPAFCKEQFPNPFFHLAPFYGTKYYEADKLQRDELNRPFPEFTGMTERTRNDGASWYNSLQVVFEKRAKGGLTLNSTYTLAKQIDRFDFNDSQKNIMRQGLTEWDRPHRFTLASVYQLPFGKGKRWLNTSSPFWSRVISGWENTWIFQWQSGSPWGLPGNVIIVKDPGLPQVDWSAPTVYGLRPCVVKLDDSGNRKLIGKQGAGTTNERFGCSLTDYNFLITPSYAPRFTPDRDGRIRLHTAPQADVSLNKLTRITERVGVQFRAEAFNVFNKFVFARENFNNNAESDKFGTIEPAFVGIGNSNFPRQVQLAVKVIW